MIKYHCPESCNKCNGDNKFILPSYDGSLLLETKTACKDCDHEDYWAYGYFESGSDVLDNCDKYYFDASGFF